MEIIVKSWRSEPKEDWRREYNKVEIFDYPSHDQFLNLKQKIK